MKNKMWIKSGKISSGPLTRMFHLWANLGTRRGWGHHHFKTAMSIWLLPMGKAFFSLEDESAMECL